MGIPVAIGQTQTLYIVFISVTCALVGFVSHVGALECFHCHDVHSGQDCHNTDSCPTNQLCHTNSTAISGKVTFNLGCKPREECSSTNLPLVSMVGRAILSSTSQAPVTVCSECCGAEYCNKHLCIAPITATTGNGACQDDANYNCQLTSGTFNVCDDIHHAKLVCRHFCGLCHLADGGWSAWGRWSACDVTCDIGTATRSRACANPAPAHGGLDCVGAKLEHQNCRDDTCPANSGWNGWSTWGACSVTCGVGMARRNRKCSNPLPGALGFPCIGDSQDYMICLPGACDDGGWSPWSPWTTCSATCGGGLSTRNRNCTNPSPSQFGRMCVGSTDHTVVCNTDNCPIAVSAFTVTGREPGPTAGTIRFTRVLYNEGGDYNTTTGKFTCRYPGLYSFTLDLLTTTRSSVYCYLYKNSVQLTMSHTSTRDGGEYSTSSSVAIRLRHGDTVYPGGCNNISDAFRGHYSSFTGFRISS